MEITADMIKELRAATNAGVLDCRKALQESNGDFQKAVDGCVKRAWQLLPNAPTAQASNGMVEMYSHGGGRVGVMVEVNCETDFVARSEQFRTLGSRDCLADRGQCAQVRQARRYSCRGDSSTRPRKPAHAARKKASPTT